MKLQTSQKFVATLLSIIFVCHSQQITIITGLERVSIMNEGVTNPQFIRRKTMNCAAPNLYIYQDFNHKPYNIQFKGVKVDQIFGVYHSISSNMQQSSIATIATIDNECPFPSKNSMNVIKIKLKDSDQNIEYVVNCSPTQIYKPFQWGLFLLIMFCTIVITLSSLYSRAWAYGGLGINISKTFLLLFNLIVGIGFLFAYISPILVSLVLKIVGSALGTFGVMVGVVQSLWLTQSNKIKKQIFFQIRIIDIIGFILGVFTMIIYWISDGNWIVNDILAVSTIVACIKIFKLRSLKIGMALLFSTLLLQIAAGLFIHYIMKQSYNNLVIEMFESPVVIVFPSLTPQLFRKCAWLPLTNVIFPGLVISYFRRFDVSRSTSIYLIVGYLSYYLGSIVWMIVDVNNVHAWPVAIISDPVTLIIVLGISIRRNQFKTLWAGTFYDDENPDIHQQLIRKSATKGSNGSNQHESNFQIQDLTEDIKIDHKSNLESSSGVYVTND